jgi:hypothetical protein
MEEEISVIRIKRNTLALYIVCLLFGVWALFGCGGAPELERTQPRHKLTIEGTFITESPDEIRFPIKVLFAIDCSLSMGDSVDGQLAGSDPHFLRIEAVRNFIDTYNSNENTSFEIMLWNNDVFERTRTINGQGGFTKDPDEINRVLNRVRNDTMTDYLGTLDAIHADIERDINKVKAEEEQNLIRSKYIVVFLSDGMSNVQGGRQSDADIWNQVGEIYKMAAQNGVGHLISIPFSCLETFLRPGMDKWRSRWRNRPFRVWPIRAWGSSGCLRAPKRSILSIS